MLQPGGDRSRGDREGPGARGGRPGPRRDAAGDQGGRARPASPTRSSASPRRSRESPYTRYRRVMGLRIEVEPGRLRGPRGHPREGAAAGAEHARGDGAGAHRVAGEDRRRCRRLRRPNRRRSARRKPVARRRPGRPARPAAATSRSRSRRSGAARTSSTAKGTRRSSSAPRATSCREDDARDHSSKDKDRIGPYISITRIRKDTFKDLVDVQLLDIKESLLADYVAASGGRRHHAHARARPRRGDARHANRALGAVRREARERNALTAGARCS